MRVAVRSSEAGTAVAQRIRRRLVSAGAKVADRMDQGDVAVLVGETRFFLQTLVDLPRAPPLLLVAASGRGALAQVAAGESEQAADRIAEGRYEVDAVARMRCAWDGGEAYALNEAALLPAVNGTFLSYELRVDGELLWRDRGDGVLATTPTGSTAYALSAGGPVVLSAAPVFGVVPISSEMRTSPLIVPQSALVELGAIEAGGGAQLVVDGHARHRVGREGVRITGAPEPLRLIRFEKRRHAEVLGRVRARGDIGAELGATPPSARFVFKLLEHEGPFTAAQIARATGLTPRTVRTALQELHKRGLVVRRGSLRDVRTAVYDVAGRTSEEDFSSRGGTR